MEKIIYDKTNDIFDVMFIVDSFSKIKKNFNKKTTKENNVINNSIKDSFEKVSFSF